MAAAPIVAPAASLTALPDVNRAAEFLEMTTKNTSQQSTEALTISAKVDDLEGSSDSVDQSSKAREEANHVTGFRLVVIVVCLMLAIFCVALDNTIIATAIPRITDHFHSIEDVGWYGSAYLLTTCAFQLLYAKWYTFYPAKTVFLIALSIFEIGSLICATAPSSTALIVGRAIAGLGSAGLFTGAMTAIAQVAPMEKRPLILGLVGGLFGISAVIGPLLGGALTDRTSWRWCFYINLPIGAVTVVGITVFLHVNQQLEKANGGIVGQIMRFDPIGNILFICAVICLLLALQWGGTTYDWSNGRIIALFVLFGILFLAFIAVQFWLGEEATIPSRVVQQRTIRFASLFALFIGGTVFSMIYYLPIWFQAIHGDDAVFSAVHMLPMILTQVICVVLSGGLTKRIGYYMPFVWLSVLFMPIGIGLIHTWSTGTPEGKWIGYQILLGIGIGCGFQQANVAAQAVLPLKDVPTGVAVVFSAQFLGGTIFVSVAENVFTNHLRSNLLALAIPNFNPEIAIRAGATSLRTLVAESFLNEVLVAYNNAIMQAFQVSLIMSCLTIFGASGMEWINMEGAKPI